MHLDSTEFFLLLPIWKKIKLPKIVQLTIIVKERMWRMNYFSLLNYGRKILSLNIVIPPLQFQIRSRPILAVLSLLLQKLFWSSGF